MFVILGVRRVKPEYVDDYVKTMSEMTALAMAEPGCLRYDLLRDNDDPTVFILYECFVDEEAARAHQTAPAHDRWREMAADWYAERRGGRGEATSVD